MNRKGNKKQLWKNIKKKVLLIQREIVILKIKLTLMK